MRYVIGGPAFTAQVLAVQTGTAVPHISSDISSAQIAGFELCLPAMQEQRAVGQLLGLLDDRIDLLRQTNATLEAIAQALFKSWFIDFDPVRARQAGREPEGMDAATAALFPAEFEESALGLIPKGWRAGTFGDLATLVKGTTNPLNSPSAVFEHYSLPAFDAGQLSVIETGDAIKSTKTRMSPGVVLQSKLNPHIPRVWFPYRVGEKAVCSTEFLPWLAKDTASPEIVYCILTSASFESEVRMLVTGTSNSPPPRQNSCRPDMILNLGATRKADGTVRRSIQEQSGGAVAAAGERGSGRGGERDRSVGADIGTLA